MLLYGCAILSLTHTHTHTQVPVRHLIGEENSGFMQVLTNFNHERLVIAVAACRMARINYEVPFCMCVRRHGEYF
jgi:alkylation response protein AidB-like acyl-CoA dehydrogenase